MTGEKENDTVHGNLAVKRIEDGWQIKVIGNQELSHAIPSQKKISKKIIVGIV